MARSAPLFIAVDGRSGAGKSTLALELATALRAHRSVALFHLEDIYPGWDGLAEGIERYVSRVLDPLHWGEDARWSAWDWAANADGERRTTAQADVVVLEGVGAAAAQARRYLDAVVWVEVEDAERRRRALARDGATYAPHWDRWAAQEDAWLARDPVEPHADVLVRNAADGRAPADALRALAALPGLQVALWPEIEKSAAAPLLHRRVALPPSARTPEVFATLYGNSTHAVLLDSSSTGAPADAPGSPSGAARANSTSRSAPGGDERSRFSILADDAGAAASRAEHRAGTTTVTTGCASARVPGGFFGWLDRNWGRARAAAPAGLASGFALGWLGWLGYELKRETGGPQAPPSRTADAALIHPARGVVLDHWTGTAWLLALAAPDAQEWLDDAQAAVTACGSAAGAPRAAGGSGGGAADIPAADASAAGTDAGAGSPSVGVPGPDFSCADTRDRYLEKVRLAQAEITEGNSYEVCLTTSLDARVPGSGLEPWAVYLRLRERNPAPFAHFVRFGPTVLASTSPERFLRIDPAGMMRAEPIKGTRGRSGDPGEDARLAAELAASPKDRAENIMIVDLMRNDLVRSADPATLSVPRLCAIESYATVHQMVSTIDARLRPDASRAEAVAFAFPPGSMTGAPKASTMAILDRLEDRRPRGVYSGVAGYFSHNGAADLSVVIRTLVMQREPDDAGWHLSLGLGGAITADSDPAEEWDEVRTKARGVLGALGSSFPAS